jgi:hypothetical protein
MVVKQEGRKPGTEDEFVGEALSPVGGTLDTDAMSRGEPGLPRAFVWRDREYPVVEVLERWKTTSDCKSGSDEQYVRKHWFRIRTADGTQMRVYFERQPRSGRQRKARWWLYAVSRPDGT